MELKGKVKAINDLSNVSIQKKQVIVEVESGKYKNDIAIDFLKEKASLLDGVEVGYIVDIGFNLSSREYNGKWYTNASGWVIKVCLYNDLPI